MTDTSTDLARVSDAERQFVVERLRDEAAAGRLPVEEFDRRAVRAYTVRTRDQLLTLLPAPAEDGDQHAGEPVDEPVDEITVIPPAPRRRRWQWRR